MSRLVVPLLVAMLAACSSSGPDGPAATTARPASTVSEPRHPDVVAASATRQSDGRWAFTATLSSPYDSPDRYADAWRVVGPDGTVYGVRELLHDHAAEQPFTRSLPDVAVPDEVDMVEVEGRDLVHGWGGATVTVALER